QGLPSSPPQGGEKAEGRPRRRRAQTRRAPQHSPRAKPDMEASSTTRLLRCEGHERSERQERKSRASKDEGGGPSDHPTLNLIKRLERQLGRPPVGRWPGFRSRRRFAEFQRLDAGPCTDDLAGRGQDIVD